MYTVIDRCDKLSEPKKSMTIVGDPTCEERYSVYPEKLFKFLKLPVFEPPPEKPKIHFKVFGIVCNKSFQKCRCYVEKLCKAYPKDYAEPEIKPMLNTQWNDFITKVKRKVGTEKIWTLRKQVAIFIDGNFIGDDLDLIRFVTLKYKMYICKDFEEIGNTELINYLKTESELGRTFLYFTIAIDDKVIGSLLFKLYVDLVPQISEIFARRCYKKVGGFVGTPVQRIVLPSWIQCGGWKLKHFRTPCENYIIPHDRRGVLSICNNGKHTDNSTQFCISLGPTPWMDYRYVAFGQMIQGDEVLQIIESVPTHYEAPTKKIQIVSCGEFTFYPTVDDNANLQLQKFLQSRTRMEKEIADIRDVKSELLRRRYKLGFYFEKGDMRSYKPFCHLPEYLLYKYLAEIEPAIPEEEQSCQCLDLYGTCPCVEPEKVEEELEPMPPCASQKSIHIPKNFKCEDRTEIPYPKNKALCKPFANLCVDYTAQQSQYYAEAQEQAKKEQRNIF